MIGSEFTFASLTPADLQEELLDSFIRTQHVHRVWRMKEGQKTLVTASFTDDWDQQTKLDIVASDWRICLAGGGMVHCALHNGRIVAFATLLRELFGSRKQYADLLQLHVSSEVRHKGLGRTLFMKCAEQAGIWGARKLYISSHSAEETYSFYRAMGCVPAEELHLYHVRMEPFDLQLEYDL
ncbi:GNAT family N-acetyltransferase [Paenibacillus albidus]|uniref:GNAT family N-acetyltransferase n=1 Tax=Paenibacillus albidus TaxID=2041023 RepID=UPI001BEB80A7|nr:GNAT family N-acetyltransferase [Paenibacillus albidus]MBT2292299.1 GNAT family N-acetyltransferase [Paenibacillus albidus]